MPIDRNQCSINVVVVHPNDAASQLALLRMTELVIGEAIEPFIFAWASPGHDLPTGRVSGENADDIQLSELLAQIERLERVRVIGLFCPLTGSEAAQDLNTAVRRVLNVVDEIKSQHTVVNDIRVQAITADQPEIARSAFSGLALANVVLIPHDRSSDYAAARLIESSTQDRLASHIAVELCSLLGAWSSMSESLFDNWEHQNSGSDEFLVVFARSVIRSLLCPPLPIDRIVEHGSLPMPQGYLASPNPSAAIRTVAKSVLPDELIFIPGVEPSYRREMGLSEALREIPRRLFAIIGNLPRVFREGITRDLESLQGDGLQDLIGGDASWLQVSFRDRQDQRSTPSWSDQANDAIGRLEESDGMPIVVRLPDARWQRLVSLPLAVADGSDIAEEALAATGERQYLVADPLALAGVLQADSGDAVRHLISSLDPDASPEPRPEIPLDPSEEVTENSEDEREQNDNLSRIDSPSDQESGIEQGTEESGGQELSEPHDDKPEPDTGLSDRVLAELGSDAPEKARSGGLLGAITESMLEEKRRADRHLSAMVEQMARLRDESSENNHARRPPQAVRVLLTGSLLSVIFTAVVFTRLADVSDLSWLGGISEFALWLGFSAVLAGTSLFLLGSSTGKGRTMAAGACGLLVVALVLALSTSIGESEVVREKIGTKFWPLWPITSAISLIGVATWFTFPYQVGNWRSALARFLGWFTIAYVLVVLIVASSVSASALQTEARYLEEQAAEADDPELVLALDSATCDSQASATAGRACRHIKRVDHFSSNLQRTMLISALVVSALAALIGLAIIAVFWVRIEYRNRNQGAKFRFAHEEALQASRARRRLQLLITQWIGTAAALSRIIWRPLGNVRHVDRNETQTFDVDDALLKFQVANLELTPQGEEILLFRLRSLMVRPGWLSAQYQRAARSYVADDPAVLAAELAPEDWPSPETCPSTPSLQEAISGSVRDMRWGFLRSLYDGNLDDSLQENLGDFSLAEVYQVLLDDEHTVSARVVADDQALEEPTGSPQRFFESVLPGGEPRLPNGMVSVPFVANDSKRKMRSFLCWPGDLLPNPVVDCELLEAKIMADLHGAIITAVRCDVSAPFPTSELKLIAEEGLVAETRAVSDASARRDKEGL